MRHEDKIVLAILVTLVAFLAVALAFFVGQGTGKTEVTTPTDPNPKTVDFRGEIERFVITPCLEATASRNLTEFVSLDQAVSLLRLTDEGSIETAIRLTSPVVEDVESLEDRKLIYDFALERCLAGVENQGKLALDGNSVVNSGLLRDEVMRQVADECDFYLQHQGNRIDFDPLEAEEMRIQIHLSRPVERNALRDRIHEVVRFQPSFYKRSLMYNAYYLLCIQQIGAAEAEGVMLQVTSTPNVPNSIAEADAVIQSLYDPQGDQRYAERARRDRAKIEVLRFIEADEADPSVRRKLESVIQELVYDIELWEL